MSILEKVRRWIDGDTSELALEEAARNAQVKPRSKAEDFIVKIARAVESVMQEEMVPLPQGTTIIPSEYMVFLNPEDDKEWRGVKRKGLEQGLYHILAERAKEIAGKKKLETKSFVIELRIDATLEKGDIRVQPGWEDSNNKTGVLARPKPAYDVPTVPRPAVQRTASDTHGVGTTPNFPAAPEFTHASANRAVRNDEPEEATQVASRSNELYKLEVWRNGVRQNVIPIFEREIVVGRGSKSKPVDIPLPGDVEVSRRHLALITDGAGNFWAVNEGKNPASVNNFDLPAGQRVAVSAGMPMTVCSYMLRIQPNH